MIENHTKYRYFKDLSSLRAHIAYNNSLEIYVKSMESSSSFWLWQIFHIKIEFSLSFFIFFCSFSSIFRRIYSGRICDSKKKTDWVQNVTKFPFSFMKCNFIFYRLNLWKLILWVKIQTLYNRLSFKIRYIFLNAILD